MKSFKDYDEQYRNDPIFHNLVKLLTQMIEQCQLTPYEIRNAATYAATKFEIMRPNSLSIIIDPNLKPDEWYLRNENE